MTTSGSLGGETRDSSSTGERIRRLLGILVWLAIGVFVGVFISEQRTARTVDASLKPSEQRIGGVGANRLSDASVDSPGETQRLQKLLSEKDDELGILRARVEELQNKILRGRSREEKLKFAEDLYDLYMKIVKSGNKDDMLELSKRFAQLDPEMAPFFIERYRATKNDFDSYVPLELALYSGGKEVTGFVYEVLTSTLYDEEQRMLLLRFLDGVSADVVPVGRIAVDEKLVQVACQLSQSENARVRMGAAGILGFSKSPEVSETLRKMAESDPDFSAKTAAFRALGRTEDKGNVSFLLEAKKVWFKPGPDGAPIPEHAAIQKAIQTSLNQLVGPVIRVKRE